MENIWNRYLTLIAVMFLSLVVAKILSYGTYPEAEAGIQAIKRIPVNIGAWRGKDYYLDERVYEILETRSIVHRQYVTRDQNVFLSIVYYPETKTGFHTPDFCLAARGIKLNAFDKNIGIETDTDPREIEIKQLVYKIDNRQELAYYFFKAGNFLGQSYIQLRLNLSINKILNKSKSASLIRVSTIVPQGDMEKASRGLTTFINELYPHLIQHL